MLKLVFYLLASVCWTPCPGPMDPCAKAAPFHDDDSEQSFIYNPTLDDYFHFLSRCASLDETKCWEFLSELKLILELFKTEAKLNCRPEKLTSSPRSRGGPWSRTPASSPLSSSAAAAAAEGSGLGGASTVGPISRLLL